MRLRLQSTGHEACCRSPGTDVEQYAMNENAKKWVAALRSGKYPQTKGYLHDLAGYCCLGVACEISGLGEWGDDGTYLTPDSSDDRSLPTGVAHWLGLNPDAGSEGSFLDDGHQTCLSGENDSGKSFAEIADIIEAHADELFVEDAPQESGSSGSAR